MRSIYKTFFSIQKTKHFYILLLIILRIYVFLLHLIMEPKFVGKAKLTTQGQLTLPQEARKDLKIDAKSEVYWYEFNNALVLVKDLVNPKELINLVLNKKNKR